MTISSISSLPGPDVRIPERLAAACRESSERITWFRRLPHAIDELQDRWLLSVGVPFEPASCAWVAPAVRIDGTRAVLKLVIIARLLRRLWRRPAALHSFRPLSDMTAYWADETIVAAPRWPDAGLVREGLRLLQELPRLSRDLKEGAGVCG